MNDDQTKEILSFLSAIKTRQDENHTADAINGLRSDVRASHEASARIADLLMAHSEEDRLFHTEIRGTLKTYSLRIGAIEEDKDKLEHKLEDSVTRQWTASEQQAIREAQVARDALAKAAANELDRSTWWKRQGALWVAAVFLIFLSACVSGSISFAVSHFPK